jgi:hypothetical protein
MSGNKHPRATDEKIRGESLYEATERQWPAGATSTVRNKVFGVLAESGHKFRLQAVYFEESSDFPALRRVLIVQIEKRVGNRQVVLEFRWPKTATSDDLDEVVSELMAEVVRAVDI